MKYVYIMLLLPVVATKQCFAYETTGIESLNYSYEYLEHERMKLSFEPNKARNRIVKANYWYLNQRLSKKSPLIIIFPGRGVSSELYELMALSLVQSGYVVMAIDMPEIGKVVYPDGETIWPNAAYSPGELMRGPYEKVDKFFEPAVEIGLKDANLVYQTIIQPSHFINNKIDFSRIGIIGHSLGGRIAGGFADKTSNIKALASFEGIPPRQIRMNGLSMPQAHLVTEEIWPYAKDNYQMIIDNSIDKVYLTKVKGMKHNSMLGKGKLQSDPDKYNLKIIAGYINLFFDEHVKRNENLLHFNEDRLETELYGISRQ